MLGLFILKEALSDIREANPDRLCIPYIRECKTIFHSFTKAVTYIARNHRQLLSLKIRDYVLEGTAEMRRCIGRRV